MCVTQHQFDTYIILNLEYNICMYKPRQFIYIFWVRLFFQLHITSESVLVFIKAIPIDQNHIFVLRKIHWSVRRLSDNPQLFKILICQIFFRICPFYNLLNNGSEMFLPSSSFVSSCVVKAWTHQTKLSFDALDVIFYIV